MEIAQIKRIIRVCTHTGKIMLQNGAETYRVEDTVQRMAESKGLQDVNVFVIPTGIMFSAEHGNETITVLERVNPEGIDLESIDRANEFSRKFTLTDMPTEEAETNIAALYATPQFSKKVRILASGMGGGFFVLMFGGTFIEFILAYIASSMTVYITDTIDSKHLNFFIRNIIGGFTSMLIAVLSIVFIRAIGFDATLTMVIVGPLMTLVPGVSLTNGIRDLISGELLAGSAKIMEALFIAIALAFGVGMVLQFSLKLL
jgi:uncharacterized membrane protein YjjP (DUF1212 family)